MAQSTSTEPSFNHLAEAPAQVPTSITTIHQHTITSPEETPTNIFLPLNPVLAILAPGPASTSVINAQPALHLDAPISHGNILVTTEDEDDIWQTMVKIFDQGLQKRILRERNPKLQ